MPSGTGTAVLSDGTQQSDTHINLQHQSQTAKTRRSLKGAEPKSAGDRPSIGEIPGAQPMETSGILAIMRGDLGDNGLRPSEEEMGCTDLSAQTDAKPGPTCPGSGPGLPS